MCFEVCWDRKCEVLIVSLLILLFGSCLCAVLLGLSRLLFQLCSCRFYSHAPLYFLLPLPSFSFFCLLFPSVFSLYSFSLFRRSCRFPWTLSLFFALSFFSLSVCYSSLSVLSTDRYGWEAIQRASSRFLESCAWSWCQWLWTLLVNTVFLQQCFLRKAQDGRIDWID